MGNMILVSTKKFVDGFSGDLICVTDRKEYDTGV